MRRCMLAVLMVLTSFAWPPAASAQLAPFCRPGESPQFTFGFAALKGQLGATMGEPIECAHPNSANGDVLQNTTRGLSFWRKSTNTPTFTDGYRHWGLTIGGLAYWEGDAIDPPGSVAAAPAPRQAAPVPRAGWAPSYYLPRDSEIGRDFRQRVEENKGTDSPTERPTYLQRVYYSPAENGGIARLEVTTWIAPSPTAAREGYDAIRLTLLDKGWQIKSPSGLAPRTSADDESIEAYLDLPATREGPALYMQQHLYRAGAVVVQVTGATTSSRAGQYNWTSPAFAPMVERARAYPDGNR